MLIIIISVFSFVLALPSWFAESCFSEYNTTVIGENYTNLHGGPSLTADYAYIGAYLQIIWAVHIGLLVFSSTLYVWMYFKTRKALKQFTTRVTFVEQNMLNTAGLMFILNALFVTYLLLR